MACALKPTKPQLVLCRTSHFEDASQQDAEQEDELLFEDEGEGPVDWGWSHVVTKACAASPGAQAFMVDDSSFDRSNRPGWKKMKWQDAVPSAHPVITHTTHAEIDLRTVNRNQLEAFGPCIDIFRRLKING